MRPNETDVNNPVGIVDPHHHPILITAKIEHHAAVLEDTRAAHGTLKTRSYVFAIGLPLRFIFWCRYRTPGPPPFSSIDKTGKFTGKMSISSPTSQGQLNSALKLGICGKIPCSVRTGNFRRETGNFRR
jgi:hypothetical protein